MPFQEVSYSGSMVERGNSKLSSEKPGRELVHGKGQRYGPWALPAIVHSGLATKKGSTGKGMGKGIGEWVASNG